MKIHSKECANLPLLASAIILHMSIWSDVLDKRFKSVNIASDTRSLLRTETNKEAFVYSIPFLHTYKTQIHCG